MLIKPDSSQGIRFTPDMVLLDSLRLGDLQPKVRGRIYWRMSNHEQLMSCSSDCRNRRCGEVHRTASAGTLLLPAETLGMSVTCS